MKEAALRILIVDDHTMFRQGLRVLLEEAPDLTIVGEAGDGFEAIEKTRALRPDIVLMDIRMPGCDGIQVASTLRHELPEVKVIILAVDIADSSLVYRAIRSGALGYVSKHNRIEELVHAIRQVARGEAVLTPQSLTSLVTLLREAPDVSTSRVPMLERLSAREQEVLNLLAQGKSNRDIANALCVTEGTVRAHIHNVLDKLHLSNRVQAATYALGITTAKNGRLAEDSLHL